MELCLNLFSSLSALSALVAAAFWLLSARVNVPTVYVDEGMFVGGNDDPYKPQKVSPIVLALREQSKLSARGAIAAAIAALSSIPPFLGLDRAICW